VDDIIGGHRLTPEDDFGDGENGDRRNEDGKAIVCDPGQPVLLFFVEIILDHLMHADPHMDAHIDDEGDERHRNERIADDVHHLGAFGARETNHEPDEEDEEQHIERAREALRDELARPTRVAVSGLGVGDNGLVDHWNHTKIAHAPSVRRIEAASWMRTITSRPTGSSALMLSHTKWRTPPSMW